MFFELLHSKVQCQKWQALGWTRKCVVAWLCSAGVIWWGCEVRDCLLSHLKSENVAIILFSEFLKGHLNPSGHYWDVFWEANFVPGLRSTAVIVCRGKAKWISCVGTWAGHFWCLYELDSQLILELSFWLSDMSTNNILLVVVLMSTNNTLLVIVLFSGKMLVL